MSFVNAIRDYVETLNTVTTTLSQDFTLTTFLSETAVYVLKTLQSALLYILSFQWIRDFTLLPIVLPQLSTALFKETFVLETPSKVFFDFLEIPDFHQNKFLLGFFNSFFFTLPLSIVHIVTVRRLLIQGIPSAVYTIGGYLLGQFLFLTCTVFGLRFILIPWLTLEPLNYLLGIILIFRTIYRMVRENLVELKGWGDALTWPRYKSFFITSFLLAWCEQSSIFSYLGNLTFSSNVSLLESFSSSNPLSSFFTHSAYLMGISFGALFFSSLWGIFFLQVKNLFLLYTPLFTSTFIQWINKTTFVVTLALTLTSIPFYGFEYLMTSPLGFVSQDNVFKTTLFDQTRVKDIGGIGLLSSPESNLQFLDVDVAPFDRGEYLTTPGVAQPLSFEELNYRGEFDWIARQDKVSTLTDSRGGFFSLSKLFKKQLKSQDQMDSRQIDRGDITPLLSENDQTAAFDLLDTSSPVIQRFTTESALDFENSQENDLIGSYHDLYVTSFPENRVNPQGEIEKNIQKKIKQKYYSNPVYKTLLTLDIDLFLNRQPKTSQLNASQEVDLDTKRRIVESYYDSLREYANLPYSESFDIFFDGTKSFSNKVYNQQFKGTLRSVRRLFALTPNSEDESGLAAENLGVKTVLKFDQPAYDVSENQKFSAYHEELIPQGKQGEKENLINEGFHQSFKNDKGISFIGNPLYAGWDETLRKFVITNKLLPRNWAGYKVVFQPENQGVLMQKSQPAKQKIKFTAWPLSQEVINKPKTELNIPYVTLFKPRSILTDKGQQLSYQIPANLERFELNKKKEYQFITLQPKRGGFIWPGNAQFNFSSILPFLTTN